MQVSRVIFFSFFHFVFYFFFALRAAIFLFFLQPAIVFSGGGSGGGGSSGTPACNNYKIWYTIYHIYNTSESFMRCARRVKLTRRFIVCTFFLPLDLVGLRVDVIDLNFIAKI